MLGYEAVRAWRNVQVERPSCSTSGGQSDDGVRVVEKEAREDERPESAVDFLVMEAQEAKEVQERQLERLEVLVLGEDDLLSGRGRGTVCHLFPGRRL